MYGGTVYKYPLFDDLKERIKQIQILQDLSEFYIADEENFKRLEKILYSGRIETTENDRPGLLRNYDNGVRNFIISARGTGTAHPIWKEEIGKILDNKDTTVMVITAASQGDVDLQKYAAGLYISGVLSGRTLQQDAGIIMVAIIHDLMHNFKYNISQAQEFIERHCWMSGIL